MSAGMGYPDNVLAAGEHVIVHRHPHWKRLIWPVLVLILVTGLAAFGSGYLNSTHFEQLAKNIGTRVRAHLPGGKQVDGTASAIDDQGRLCLESGGQTVVVAAGDVVHLR